MADILRMAASAARSDPRTAFLAVCGVTDLVWGIADEGDALIDVRNSRDLPGVPVLDRHDEPRRQGGQVCDHRAVPGVSLPLVFREHRRIVCC